MPPSPDPFDFESALEACARGERFALRMIHEREAPRLFGVVARIVRDEAVAQEVLQEAFLLVWQSAGRYQRALGSARGWIYTVVRHRALDEARRGRPETPMGDDLEAIADAAVLEPPPDDHRAGALERCLAALDTPKRTCVLEAFVEGRTQTEIAARLAVPLGTVKTWIRRGLLSLKDCMT